MGIYNWHLSPETATLWEEDIYVNVVHHELLQKQSGALSANDPALF